MARYPLMADIFKEIKSKKKNADKIELIQWWSNQYPMFTELMAYVVNPNIKWLLPEGAPPFKKGETIDAEPYFWVEIRRFYTFVDCQAARGIRQVQRENQFASMLSTFHPRDAELFIAIKDRKITYITEKLVKEALPGLLTY